MMGRPRWVATSVVALLLCIAAPVWSDNRCGGGGKPRPDEGGIGGTGERPVAPDEDDSGIGGTGISEGDTGIIGTITGFASVCVGGIEVHYDAQSRIAVDDQPASAQDLAVGQVVEVVASGSGDEVHARSIVVRHVVVGPVTGFDDEHDRLQVMGQAVEIADADKYEIGKPVRVSGYRRPDGVVVASLISAASGETVSVDGPVSEVAPGRWSIAGTPVTLAEPKRATLGDEVRVAGRWDGQQLVPDSIEWRPRVPFDGRVSRVAIEGFTGGSAANQLRIGSFEFDVPQSKELPDDARGSRVRIQATIQDRRAVLQDVGVVGDRPPRPLGGPERGKVFDRIGPGSGKGAVEMPGREGMPPRALDAKPEAMHPGAERPERPALPDSPDRPERPERPERPVMPDVPERPPRMERPPRPERPDMPRRP